MSNILRVCTPGNGLDEIKAKTCYAIGTF